MPRRAAGPGHDALSRAAARALVRWFAREARDLPWRRARTPYRVLVSELMLQQTTVAAVVPYFERFVAELPDFPALAGAPLERVLELWAGLGYYRRARMLHAAAREVVGRHGGSLPADAAAVRALPGVGPYTAGAVLAIAHGVPEPAVDGNVARVLARWTATPWRADLPKDRRAIEGVVRELLAHAPPGALTEALMELGATTCTPRAPSCTRCPLSGSCRALAEGRVDELPPPRARAPGRVVVAEALVAVRRGRVLLWQRPEGARLMPGLWELPGTGLDEPPATRGEVLDLLGGGSAGAALGEVRHVVTTRRVRVTLRACRLDAPPRSGRTRRWVTPEEARGLALTGAARRGLDLLDAHELFN